jgi:hypothetical protein
MKKPGKRKKSKRKRKTNRINMSLRYFFSILTILMVNKSIGQTLSKSEIRSFWKEGMVLDNERELNRVLGSFQFHDTIEETLQLKIKKLGVKFDTVGLFLIERTGMVSLDSCERGSYLSKVYIFWKEAGKTYMQKITNRCLWAPTEVKVSFFDFYKKNLTEINDEQIMPGILGAKKDGDKIIYNTTITSHEYSYFIFCKVGETKKLLRFSESDLSNKEGLFYYDNRGSKAYEWFLNLERDIKKF